MNISSTPAVQAATAAAASTSVPADAVQASVQLRVLKKALDAQEAAAAALLQSLPPPPVPQGMLGTRLDVYA
ncbi:putative motility protein [Pseudorhodoferax sp.]|uniref:putative motility protein n=1 Tax=Pseudorhodoferax sp. TaxID=1993553 RepID=UPI002DD6B032|nr:putative motility protein [Pseudorhodoferax sp.]